MKIKKGYITATGINYAGTLPKIKKNPNQFQPVYEAITNSLEAIKMLKERYRITDNREIKLKLLLSKDLFSKDDSNFNFQAPGAE